MIQIWTVAVVWNFHVQLSKYLEIHAVLYNRKIAVQGCATVQWWKRWWKIAMQRLQSLRKKQPRRTITKADVEAENLTLLLRKVSIAAFAEIIPLPQVAFLVWLAAPKGIDKNFQSRAASQNFKKGAKDSLFNVHCTSANTAARNLESKGSRQKNVSVDPIFLSCFWPQIMNLCVTKWILHKKKSKFLDDHFQQAGPSGLPFARNQSLQVIICNHKKGMKLKNAFLRPFTKR